MKKPTMTLASSRWAEFKKRLTGPEGCDFRGGPALKDTKWNCSSKIDRPRAIKVLTAMGFDVDSSFKYFEEHGGYCDCEILFNVEPRNPKLKSRRIRRSRARAAS